MELAMITTRQVMELFCMILAGCICSKTGAIKEEAKKGFSDLLLYLVVPAMVVHSYMTEFDEKILANLVLTLIWSTIALVIGIVVAMVATAKMKGSDKPIICFAGMFSNAAYMGFPLIQALFGAEGLMYASVFVTVFNILLWTVGYSVVTKTTNLKAILKTIGTSPVILSVILGLILYLGQISVPEVIAEPVRLIGNINTPLAMIITGMIIGTSDLKKMAGNPMIWYVTLIRMVLVPAICFVVFRVIGAGSMVAEVVLLLEACPCAAITSVFAVQYGYHEDLAAGTVVVSTLLSIVTLPVCAMLLTVLM